MLPRVELAGAPGLHESAGGWTVRMLGDRKHASIPRAASCVQYVQSLGVSEGLVLVSIRLHLCQKSVGFCPDHLVHWKWNPDSEDKHVTA